MVFRYNFLRWFSFHQLILRYHLKRSFLDTVPSGDFEIPCHNMTLICHSVMILRYPSFKGVFLECLSLYKNILRNPSIGSHYISKYNPLALTVQCTVYTVHYTVKGTVRAVD